MTVFPRPCLELQEVLSSLYVKTGKERLLQEQKGASLYQHQKTTSGVLWMSWVLHFGLQSKPQLSLNSVHPFCLSFCSLPPRSDTELFWMALASQIQQRSLNLNPWPEDPTSSVHISPILLCQLQNSRPLVSVEPSYCLTQMLFCWKQTLRLPPLVLH